MVAFAVIAAISIGCDRVSHPTREVESTESDPALEALDELQGELDVYRGFERDLKHRVDRLHHEGLTEAVDYVIAREDSDGSRRAQQRMIRHSDYLGEIVTRIFRDSRCLQQLSEWMTDREADLRHLSRQHNYYIDGMDEGLLYRARLEIEGGLPCLRDDDVFYAPEIWIHEQTEQFISRAREEKHRREPTPPRVTMDGVELDVHYAVSLAFEIWDFEKRRRNLQHDLDRFQKASPLKDLVVEVRERIDRVERELSVLARLYHRRIGFLAKYDPAVRNDAIQRYTERIGTHDEIRNGFLVECIPRHIESFTDDDEARREQIVRWRRDLGAMEIPALP